MVEFVGLIKVNIVRGTNLAVRDMMTSDPYVILTLGSQVHLLASAHFIIYCLCGNLIDIYALVSVAVDEDTGDKE